MTCPDPDDVEYVAPAIRVIDDILDSARTNGGVPPDALGIIAPDALDIVIALHAAGWELITTKDLDELAAIR